MVPPEAAIAALVGHAFPGGTYRIAHWENFLLTEATGSAPLPEGLAHPAHLFHVPIAGAGTTIAELFELAQAGSDSSVTIDYYDWEYFAPLREDVAYTARGGITEHARRPAGEAGAVVDSLTYRIELFDEAGTRAARASFRWHFWRLEA